MDDMTQEEMDDLIAELQEQLESGELFENATPVSELPEEEQQEIIEMLNRKNKNTRQ
jgi:BRCT domain type II-containing protein